MSCEIEYLKMQINKIEQDFSLLQYILKFFIIMLVYSRHHFIDISFIFNNFDNYIITTLLI